MTDQPASLAEALALLQTQLPRIGKDKTATVTSQRTGKTHKYDYANLATVSEQVLPLLGKLGLSFTCVPTLTEDGRFVLEYTLRHTSDEGITGVYPLPASGTPQDIGSAITYARRYCLCAVTGVAPDDDDDDGNAAELAAARAGRPRPAARPKGELPRNTDGSVSRSRSSDEELAASGNMTDAELRAHNKMTRDTQETPRRAERLTETPADDPWYQEPPAPLPAPRAAGNVAGVIHREFKRLGFTDEQRPARLKVMSTIAGRDITSTSDLTAAEALEVKRLISACRDQGVLAAKLLERQQEAPGAS